MSRRTLLEEMRGKDSRELLYDLGEARKKLFQIRMQLDSDATKGASVRDLRRGIARIMTILRQRELAENETASGEAGEPNEGTTEK